MTSTNNSTVRLINTDRVRIERVDHALGAYTIVSTDALRVRFDGEPSDCVGRVDSNSTARDTDMAIVSLRERDGSLADRRQMLAVAARRDPDLLDALRAVGALDAEPEIADDQIRALCAEARQAGDDEQVALCSAALAGNASARAKCERAIRDARAQVEA